MAKGDGCGLESLMVFLINRSVADLTCATHAQQSEDMLSSLSPQECVGTCVHLQQWFLEALTLQDPLQPAATTAQP